MIRVAIVGATGYTGEELLRILLRHPQARVTWLTAKIDSDERIAALAPRFAGRTDLVCRKDVDIDGIAKNADVVFLALPHTVSMLFAPLFLERGLKVIDLSADYRLDTDLYATWYGTAHKNPELIPQAVYGLPELYADAVKTARLIANPGCYPTSVILGCAPAFAKGIVKNHVLVDSKSGVTGAGRKAHISLIYGQVNENLKAYKISKHQHMPEMSKYLSQVGKGVVDVLFVPHLVPLNRGILSTMYLELTEQFEEEDIFAIYDSFYADAPFVRVLAPGNYPEIANVVMTNCCDIGFAVRGRRLVVVSCIDNLTKGAAGQAVQNMNIMSGLDQTTGLIE